MARYVMILRVQQHVAPLKIITYRAIKTTGTLIVIIHACVDRRDHMKWGREGG
jgi:hypothetical protein